VSTTHFLKSSHKQFDPIWTGAKTHDLRRSDDRNFVVGDGVVLMEQTSDHDGYTGRRIRAVIGYITSRDNHCALSPQALHEDFAILSLKNFERVDENGEFL